MFGKVHFNNKKLVVYTGSFNLVVTKTQYLMLSEAINQIGLKKLVFDIYEGKGSSRKIVGKEGKFKAFYDIFGE